MTEPVIIDCGSGYTKMGLASASTPTHVVPTILYRPNPLWSRDGVFPIHTSASSVDSESCRIGTAAIKQSVHNVSGSTKPILDGRVNDWSDMEQFLSLCYSDYLKFDPSDRGCIMTEPPMNPVRNRERLAESMFETFSVPSLYIGVQAVMALYAYWDGKSSITGTVIDSGDGVTHVIPVVEGYVAGAREIPIGGKDITRHIADSLVKRGEVGIGADRPESAVALNRLAKQIKEKLAYVCIDPLRELRLYDAAASRDAMFKTISWTNPVTGKPKDCEIGYERFLGPEIFFHPSPHHSSLPEMVLQSVQAAPIDYRRNLLGNIVLSGGSTLFPGFAKRVESELSSLLSGKSPVCVKSDEANNVQRFAVWNGASVLSQTRGFDQLMISREAYLEHGPSVVRDTDITRVTG